jgi:hypothetical protein
LKGKIDPMAMKVGIKTLKLLKGGRVLIEVGSIEETNLFRISINDKYGELEVTVPLLRKPMMIIRNIPKDITVDNLEETILAQNPELGLKWGGGGAAAKFKFSTKKGETNMVIEVGRER